MEIRPLTTDRLDDLADLFATNSVTRGCWCMFFLVSGRQMGWGADNRARFEELAAGQELGGTGGATAIPMGLLAYRDEEPVGWCAMGPRSRYPRAIRSPILKERDQAEDDQVWLVPCFFIRRDARRTGLTRQLLHAAVAEAKQHRATAIEGFPLAADNHRPPAEAFYGGELAFAACGFTPVARPNPRRVVMRRTLH